LQNRPGFQLVSFLLSLLIMFSKYLKVLTPINDFPCTFKSCGFLLLFDADMIIYFVFLYLSLILSFLLFLPFPYISQLSFLWIWLLWQFHPHMQSFSELHSTKAQRTILFTDKLFWLLWNGLEYRLLPHKVGTIFKINAVILPLIVRKFEKIAFNSYSLEKKLLGYFNITLTSVTMLTFLY
jgi:hypothetical protein